VSLFDKVYVEAAYVSVSFLLIEVVADGDEAVEFDSLPVYCVTI
jgi:hypothetical protein